MGSSFGSEKELNTGGAGKGQKQNTSDLMEKWEKEALVRGEEQGDYRRGVEVVKQQEGCLDNPQRIVLLIVNYLPKTSYHM